MAPISLKIISQDGAVTRKLMFDTKMKVLEAHEIVQQKFGVGDDFKLFLTSADDDLSGVWLEDFRILDYYILREGDSLHLLCRIRNLRVKMLDGAVKTLQVDESKTIGDLMLQISQKIGITDHEEYGLCYEEEVEDEPVQHGTLTLKRKAPHKEKDQLLDTLSKKLKTDDNVIWLDAARTLRELGVEPHHTLLLKRRLFYSHRTVDCRDPIQLHLLYLQARNAVLQGSHPVTEKQALDLKLINLVKENRVLYDSDHAKYMDFNAREVAWQKIGDEMRRPAADCKVRWINIRDVNRRTMRQNLTAHGKRQRPYKYVSELSFMKPFYRDIPQDTFESDEKSNDDCPPDIESEDEKPIKIKKRPRKKKKIEEEERVSISISPTEELNSSDPVDAFLLSIGATLKTLNPYMLNLAKSKIFAVVQQHELQQICQLQEQEDSKPGHHQS